MSGNIASAPVNGIVICPWPGKYPVVAHGVFGLVKSIATSEKALEHVQPQPVCPNPPVTARPTLEHPDSRFSLHSHSSKSRKKQNLQMPLVSQRLE